MRLFSVPFHAALYQPDCFLFSLFFSLMALPSEGIFLPSHHHPFDTLILQSTCQFTLPIITYFITYLGGHMDSLRPPKVCVALGGHIRAQ